DALLVQAALRGQLSRVHPVLLTEHRHGLAAVHGLVSWVAGRRISLAGSRKTPVIAILRIFSSLRYESFTTVNDSRTAALGAGFTLVLFANHSLPLAPIAAHHPSGPSGTTREHRVSHRQVFNFAQSINSPAFWPLSTGGYMSFFYT